MPSDSGDSLEPLEYTWQTANFSRYDRVDDSGDRTLLRFVSRISCEKFKLKSAKTSRMHPHTYSRTTWRLIRGGKSSSVSVARHSPK
jgi:hypothetical protein